MAYEGLTVEYMVKEAGERLFIPSNQDVVATTTMVEQCKLLSPDGVAVVVAD